MVPLAFPNGKASGSTNALVTNPGAWCRRSRHSGLPTLERSRSSFQALTLEGKARPDNSAHHWSQATAGACYAFRHPASQSCRLRYCTATTKYTLSSWVHPPHRQPHFLVPQRHRGFGHRTCAFGPGRGGGRAAKERQAFPRKASASSGWTPRLPIDNGPGSAVRRWKPGLQRRRSNPSKHIEFPSFQIQCLAALLQDSFCLLPRGFACHLGRRPSLGESASCALFVPARAAGRSRGSCPVLDAEIIPSFESAIITSHTRSKQARWSPVEVGVPREQTLNSYSVLPVPTGVRRSAR